MPQYSTPQKNPGEGSRHGLKEALRTKFGGQNLQYTTERYAKSLTNGRDTIIAHPLTEGDKARSDLFNAVEEHHGRQPVTNRISIPQHSRSGICRR